MILNIEQKKQIFERREQAPEESFTTIANFFTAKWGIKIDRSMACRWHKLFKDHKKGTEVNAADMVRSRLVPAIVRKFETELYQQINDHLVKSPMNFETVKILGLRLQRTDDLITEDTEELIILGEIKSGETGAVFATPNDIFCQNVVKNNKKRKQPEITDFYAKKHIN